MSTITSLSGDRCLCPSCSLPFNSTRAFDKHRTGPYQDARRCLSVEEMRARGMSISAAGYWVTKAMSAATITNKEHPNAQVN